MFQALLTTIAVAFLIWENRALREVGGM